MIGRVYAVVLLVVLAGCSSTSAVKCATDADCGSSGDVCESGVCRKPSTQPDMEKSDSATNTSQPDMALSASPDLALYCGPGAASCPASFPLCGGDSVCRKCSDADTGTACTGQSVLTPRCDDSTGACAACRPSNEAQDCPLAAASVCTFDGSCRKSCTKHSDCDSGVCDMGITTGRPFCARADEVLWVQATSACASAADGTMSHPLCTIDAALAKSPSHAFIRVVGGDTPLSHVNTSIAGDVVLVSDSGMKMDAAGTVGFWLGGGHLWMNNLTIFSASTGISASSGVLTVDQMEINGATQEGMSLSATIANIDQTWIHGSKIGLDVSGGTLSVTNTILSDNSLRGLAIGQGETVNLAAYLTISHNNYNGNSTISGTSCAVPTMIYNSISWDNATGSGTGGCTFVDSDVQYAGASTYDSAPDFKTLSMFNLNLSYRLVPNVADNEACCVDRAMPLSTLVDHDIDGNPRPRGAGSDIGASEVQ
jgi:hypothetical protein